MRRAERNEPFPDEMQGRWLAVDEPTLELIVRGGEVTWRGETIDYAYKEIQEREGACHVDLRIEDDVDEYDYDCLIITSLMYAPEGELHAFSVNHASEFVRADDEEPRV